MKVGSIVFAAHLFAAGAFFLTQGCVTTEQATGRSPAARHKSPWRHNKRTPKPAPETVADQSMMQNSETDLTGSLVFDPAIEASSIETSVIATSAATPAYTAPSTGSYTVQKGDTLSGIASKFGSTTKELASMNGISDPNRLFVGQELIVPGGSSRSSAPRSSSSSRTVRKGETYTIKKGDTLSHIAVRYGVKVSEIREVNNMSNDFIAAGDTLIIPAHGKYRPPARKTYSASSASKPAPKTETKPEPAPAAVETAPVLEPESLDVVEQPAAQTTAEPQVMDYTAVQDKIIYEGETLDEIALHYSTSKEELMRLNGITDESSIQPGQKIRVPVSE